MAIRRTKGKVTVQSQFYARSGYLPRNYPPTEAQRAYYNDLKKKLQKLGLVQPDENRIEPQTKGQMSAQIKNFYNIAEAHQINLKTGEKMKEGDVGYIKTTTIKELRRNK